MTCSSSGVWGLQPSVEVDEVEATESDESTCTRLGVGEMAVEWKTSWYR